MRPPLEDVAAALRAMASCAADSPTKGAIRATAIAGGRTRVAAGLSPASPVSTATAFLPIRSSSVFATAGGGADATAPATP